ncbi:hypothetical protein IFM89_007822 [Coptis chinensis]|uniref:Pseudouridine synthase RsuA/RluA-like domain-containing protein n=1 Tax=Coptis chinensis TaxID=261450 RepID=A0A835LUQ5_9MAGN|nr:hypothetical protein IFM89_007822 [Coptis chinensis]
MNKTLLRKGVLPTVRHYSRIRPPPPAHAAPIIRVSNNIAQLGSPKKEIKPRQLLSLPAFPAKLQHPLPGRNLGGHYGQPSHVTAVTWLKYYFDEICGSVIQSHFNKGLVQMECSDRIDTSKGEQDLQQSLRKINPNEIMEVGAKIYVPVSVAETKISKRFNVIPSGTLYPNADEIEYLQRLVMYKYCNFPSIPPLVLSLSMNTVHSHVLWVLEMIIPPDLPSLVACAARLLINVFQDSAIMILNKPPKLPVKGNLPVHNSMDALAAGALSYGFEEGPKLVHRLDRESSGLLLMGRSKESLTRLQWLFSDTIKAKSPYKSWNDACEATMQRYWALVIGSPKEKQGVIHAPLSKVLLNDGKIERVIIAHPSGIEASQEAITEYRVLGPTINGCSWVELLPHTGRKHQLRVHCAEALGTPIVGDYKYGWYVHSKWKQMPRVDFEQTTGKPYKMRRPEGLDVQKGSVLSKVPLLHLHCRELVLPNIAKFQEVLDGKRQLDKQSDLSSKPDLLRFVAPMPSHMKISWNLMSSYLV